MDDVFREMFRPSLNSTAEVNRLLKRNSRFADQTRSDERPIWSLSLSLRAREKREGGSKMAPKNPFE